MQYPFHKNSFPGLLVRHFKEEKKGELLDVIAIAHAVDAEAVTSSSRVFGRWLQGFMKQTEL